MKTPTDEQLKQTLAKMLQEKLAFDESYSRSDCEPRLRWRYDSLMHYYRNDLTVLDTELLHLCWLAETAISHVDTNTYIMALSKNTGSIFHIDVIRATWQQRVIALAKVKGIDIV